MLTAVLILNIVTLVLLILKHVIDVLQRQAILHRLADNQKEIYQLLKVVENKINAM